MGLSLGSLRPNRFITKPTSAGPIIRNDRQMMKAITNARNAVIAQNTVGVIKPFFLQCLDIDAGATMQARKGELVAGQAHFLLLSRRLSSPPARGQGQSWSEKPRICSLFPFQSANIRLQPFKTHLNIAHERHTQ